MTDWFHMQKINTQRAAQKHISLYGSDFIFFFLVFQKNFCLFWTWSNLLNKGYFGSVRGQHNLCKGMG